MAQLSAKGRKRVKTFAFPKGQGPDKGRDQYPIHDRAHAANALARGAQNLSAEDLAKLTRKVCSKFPTLPKCQNRRMNSAIRKRSGRGS